MKGANRMLNWDKRSWRDKCRLVILSHFRWSAAILKLQELLQAGVKVDSHYTRQVSRCAICDRTDGIQMLVVDGSTFQIPGARKYRGIPVRARGERTE